jgi:hypothetical protein
MCTNTAAQTIRRISAKNLGRHRRLPTTNRWREPSPVRD